MAKKKKSSPFVKKYSIYLLGALFLVALAIGVWYFWQRRQKIETQKNAIVTLATTSDAVRTNAIWCPALQQAWNYLIDNFVGYRIEFNPPGTLAETLNKNHYYAIDETAIAHQYIRADLKTASLKDEIEASVSAQLAFASKILADFDWSASALDDPNDDDLKRYFLYTLCSYHLDFAQAFDLLSTGSFGTQTKKATYFGLTPHSDKKLYEQIKILYYNDDTDFAIKLFTANGEQIILQKNPEGLNFETIWTNLQQKAQFFRGQTTFQPVDALRVPVLHLRLEKNEEALTDHRFPIYRLPGGDGVITAAVQAVDLQLDGRSSTDTDAVEQLLLEDRRAVYNTSRHFFFDDKFVLFVLPAEGENPIFGALVGDIRQWQAQ